MCGGGGGGGNEVKKDVDVDEHYQHHNLNDGDEFAL